MSRVRVLSATLENLGSFRRADYGLADLGLTLVEGRNHDDPRSPSNGSGKSSAFLDLPTWVLFGEARALAADDVVHDLSGRNACGTVRLEVPGLGPVTVQRFRKVAGKSGLRLWLGTHVRDLEDAQDERHRAHEQTSLDASDTQRKIHEILGLDLRIWRAAVYRAQDDQERFAALRDSAQKELLTRVFELDVIDVWRETAKRRAQELAAKRDQVRARIASVDPEQAAARVRELEQARHLWVESQRQAFERAKARSDQLCHLRHELEAKQQQLSAAEAKLRDLPEPTPPALESLPPRPPEPQYPAEPRIELPRLKQPAPRPMLDLGAREAARAQADAEARDLTARAQREEQAARATAAKAQRAQALREGTCRECGSALTPEHATRESGRLQQEAQQQAQRAQELSAQAQEAATRARTLGQEIAALRAQEQAQAHAERAAWEAAARAHDVAQREAQAHASARWAQEVEAIRAQRAQVMAAWETQHQEVTRRNAEAVARARSAYDLQRQALELEIRGLRDAVSALPRIRAEYAAAEHEIQALAHQPWPLEAALHLAREDQARAEQDGARARAELEQLEHELRISDFWVEGLGPRGLKSFVLDDRVQELTDRANRWLQILTGGVWWVRFETQTAGAKGKLTDKFSTRVFRHLPTGAVKERSWHQWSGGQRTRLGIAIDLALAETVAARARRGFDLLVLDEVFGGLDQGGRETMMEALQVLRRERGSVVVVDHNIDLQGAFESKISVEIRNGVSVVGVRP